MQIDRLDLRRDGAAMTNEINGRLTLSVPEAGRLIYGIGRDASYAAASRGEIPTLQLGKSLRVPTHLALEAVGFPADTIARILRLPVDRTGSA